jgi:hypothetical protein
MVFYTLDAITRNYLIRKGYPLHYYMQGLVYSAACLRELTLDDLKIINTKILSVDPNSNQIELPYDYVNYIQIGIEAGQKIQPLVELNSLNSVPAYTSTFQPTTYQTKQTDQNGNLLYYGYLLPLLWNTITWNEYGENIGRLFGWGQGSQPDTFTVIKELGVIQINNDMSIDKIVLKYVSDGQSADAITQIPSEAYDTILTYIAWQFKEHSRSYSEGEKERTRQEYLTARGILRARMNDLTMEKIMRIFQKNYYAAAKS